MPSPGCSASHALEAATARFSSSLISSSSKDALANGAVHRIEHGSNQGDDGGGRCGFRSGRSGWRIRRRSVGGAASNVLCSKGQGSNFGGNQRENRQANDAKRDAEKAVGQQMTTHKKKDFMTKSLIKI
jgi:hypothetical protein